VADLNDDPVGAEAVFRRQVEAFNARDLERFLASYAADAVIHGVRDGLPLSGQEALRAHYATRLADPELHCEPLEVISWPGGWVIAREHVTSSAGVSEVRAMFSIRDGVIARAYIGL
jgi:hypothetical protein